MYMFLWMDIGEGPKLLDPMNRENWPLVVDEPVEVQDFRKITHHIRGIYGIYLKLL